MTNTTLLKRVFWLAFKASRAVGMGFMHKEVAKAQTEDSLFAEYNRNGVINTDYVYGRMMKTTFELNGDTVKVSPEKPRHDYQSWAGTYASGTDLVLAAMLELDDID